ncbi:hypothetical protein B0H14DRAFT_3513815 [Mycena olivaceomarginata]|nr:hypothetical protein B0H14DRAFT_3513815 [Mycena olivaceomarginata]
MYLFKRLDSPSLAHLVDVRLHGLDGLTAWAPADCLNLLADKAPDLRVLDVFSLHPRPLALLDLGPNFARLHRLRLTSGSAVVARDISPPLLPPSQSPLNLLLVQMVEPVYATLRSFPELADLTLGAKPANKIKGLDIPRLCVKSCPKLTTLDISCVVWTFSTGGIPKRLCSSTHRTSTLPGEFPAQLRLHPTRP